MQLTTLDFKESQLAETQEELEQAKKDNTSLQLLLDVSLIQSL